MQQIDLKEQWVRIIERFNVRRSRADVHPDMVWWVILGLFGVGLLLVAIGGYLTYGWATLNSGTTLPARGERTQVSVKDIEDLIVKYEEKQAAFDELKRAAPVPPTLGRGTSLVRTLPATTTPLLPSP